MGLAGRFACELGQPHRGKSRNRATSQSYTKDHARKDVG